MKLRRIEIRLRKLVTSMRRAVLLSLVVIAFAPPPATRAADATSTYLGNIKPSLVLVEARQGGEISFGSAFCVYSKNGVSYFITNYHVIASEATEDVYETISIVLPSNPSRRYSAEVVKPGAMDKDWPPDLAVIRANVGNLPALRLSSQRPLEGLEVGIAGFPAFQLKVWKEATEGQELRPSFHDGHVNALTLGDYYVQYDALTDQGNSGGPLFDIQTGAVYGVVDLSVKGRSVANNLAISTVEVRRFMASLALPTKAATLDRRLVSRYGERKIVARSNACTTALQRFSKHFNEWANARAITETTALKGSRGNLKSIVIAHLAEVRAAAAKRRLAYDVAAIRKSGAMPTAALAETVRGDVSAPNSVPLARSAKLKRDVQKFDTLGDCSTET